jgi:putative glycosyltransferase
MRLSIVTTLYRSAPYLRSFHARITAVAKRLTGDYEIVLVNDGSPDDSLQEALDLQADDPHIRVVDLSRNFGHHQAMWTGFRHARGEWVFLIDCDLEEEPEWLELFADRQEAEGSDVVFGVQDLRGGRWIDRWGGWVFYKLFNAWSDDPLPENLMTVRLMSRRYVDALLEHHEATFVIAGLWARTGFKQTAVMLHKERRRGSTYHLWQRARLFVNAVTSFSNKPLVFSFYLGSAIVVTALVVALGLVVSRLLIGTILSGWPSLMVSIWLLGGLILFVQGVQGIYLAKIYLETKRRPVAIVRQVYEGPQESRHASLRIAQ